MNPVLLIKSILLCLSSMGFSVNVMYIMGILDGSICNPEISIGFCATWGMLCLMGTIAGIGIIAGHEDKK